MNILETLTFPNNLAYLKFQTPNKHHNFKSQGLLFLPGLCIVHYILIFKYIGNYKIVGLGLEVIRLSKNVCMYIKNYSYVIFYREGGPLEIFQVLWIFSDPPYGMSEIFLIPPEVLQNLSDPPPTS